MLCVTFSFPWTFTQTTLTVFFLYSVSLLGFLAHCFGFVLLPSTCGHSQFLWSNIICSSRSAQSLFVKMLHSLWRQRAELNLAKLNLKLPMKISVGRTSSPPTRSICHDLYFHMWFLFYFFFSFCPVQFDATFTSCLIPTFPPLPLPWFVPPMSLRIITLPQSFARLSLWPSCTSVLIFLYYSTLDCCLYPIYLILPFDFKELALWIYFAHEYFCLVITPFSSSSGAFCQSMVYLLQMIALVLKLDLHKKINYRLLNDGVASIHPSII